MEQHNKTVRKIQSEIRSFYERGQKIRIFHGASNSTRAPKFQHGRIVDTSGLNHVLEVNAAEKYVLVEPSVSMDALVDATLEQGLMPPVVMEFPGITVGGGIQGGAAESSAFKWGGFHETALEYEMILGDGRKLAVSRTNHPELFWGTACTYGTLGVMTLVKLKLVSAPKYVKLVYQRTNSHKAAITKLEAHVHRSVDFVDGILFSPRQGVIMTGTFTDEANGSVATFLGRSDPWFYLHAKQVADKHEHYEDYIPLKDYLFRYDRGAFWMGREAFSLFRIHFNKLTRWLLDGEMHTRKLYTWLHATDMSQRYIIQDICMPRSTIQEILNYIDHKLDIYPLWLLPLKPSGESLDKFGLSFTKDPIVINVGVWGKAKSKNFEEFVAINREVEQEVFRLNGRKTLYAHAYYPRDEFWQLYDQMHYNNLRDKYNANIIFENIYDKVTVRRPYDAPLGTAFRRRLKADLRKLLVLNITGSAKSRPE